MQHAANARRSSARLVLEAGLRALKQTFAEPAHPEQSSDLRFYRTDFRAAAEAALRGVRRVRGFG